MAETMKDRIDVNDPRELLFFVQDKLYDVRIKLERAKVMSDNVSFHYFFESLEKHKENGGLALLNGYDENRIFAEIDNENVSDAIDIIEEMIEELEPADLITSDVPCQRDGDYGEIISLLQTIKENEKLLQCIKSFITGCIKRYC